MTNAATSDAHASASRIRVQGKRAVGQSVAQRSTQTDENPRIRKLIDGAVDAVSADRSDRAGDVRTVPGDIEGIRVRQVC